MEIDTLFDNIMDVPGIEGACLFGIQGPIYVNRLPAFLTNDIFAEAQRRIVAMYETMDENFMPSDDYLLRFSERWLLVRRTDNHVLLVLGGEKANLASTRMVTNMTIKRLTPAVLEQLAASAAAKAPSLAGAPMPGASPALVLPPPVPVVATEEAPLKTLRRMYRGQPY